VRTVAVPLGQRSYRIKIAPNLVARLGEECRRLKLGPRCAVLSDTHVARRFAKSALTSLKRAGFEPFLITVPAGEKSKSLVTVQHCHDKLAAHRLERGSFIVALGGGVVGDLAGFVAATHLRGIAYVQVPTTLLAQVDSSVGGKTGVNLKAGKNLVGAFHQPCLVLCDLDTLMMLPEREYRSGLAEVIKYGIIRDATLFRQLERNLPGILARDPKVLGPIIARCCAIKAKIVGRDEREGGLRAVLNFGHTIGHALETVSGYGRYLHGEAISIGQVAAVRLSEAALGFPAAQAQRTTELFQRAGLPVAAQLNLAARRSLFNAMQQDKKVRGGRVRFVLARRIGSALPGQEVADSLIHRVLEAILSRKP
jgi:3-dehydroquinate synthase